MTRRSKALGWTILACFLIGLDLLFERGASTPFSYPRFLIFPFAMWGIFRLFSSAAGLSNHVARISSMWAVGCTLVFLFKYIYRGQIDWIYNILYSGWVLICTEIVRWDRLKRAKLAGQSNGQHL